MTNTPKHARPDMNEAKARAFDRIAAILGSWEEWGADHLDEIADVLIPVVATLGLPSVGGQTQSGLQYWRAIADNLGVYYPGGSGDIAYDLGVEYGLEGIPLHVALPMSDFRKGRLFASAVGREMEPRDLDQLPSLCSSWARGYLSVARGKKVAA